MKITTIKEYLELMSSMCAAGSKKRTSKYSCFEDFVLKHGDEFTAIGPLPKGAKLGIPKHCYMNATKLVLNNSDLIYCEGFASGIIPVMHAWCLTRSGTVIDPTWDDGREYFGIPIKRSYLIKSIMKYKVYGVIDLWEHRWPILKVRPSEFKERL